MDSRVSFGQLFRFIFVLFSLFIIGDAFYRWDGFRYYATFSDFLPGAALVLILWSIVAVTSSILIWLLLKLAEWLFDLIGRKIDSGNLLIFLCWLITIGCTALISKRYLVNSALTFQLKLVLILGVILATSFLTWILRGKFNIILDRITPLVWLFGFFVIISVPVVTYHTWIKGTGTVATETVHFSGTDKNRPNIVLVTFDALSVNNMSMYGYKRKTTPYINEWAQNATVFTNAKASDGYTTPTTASLMTGKRPWTHRTYHQRSAVHRGDIENIALMLKQNGYYAVAYVENKNASPVSLNIHKGFNVYKSFIPEEQDLLGRFHSFLYGTFFEKIQLYDWILLDDFAPTALFKRIIYYPIYYPFYLDYSWKKNKKMPLVKSVSILDRFMSDIDSIPSQKPFFSWLHLMPPHEPYLPPEPFLGTFDSSSKLRTVDEQYEYSGQAIRNIDALGHFTEQDLKLLDTYRARYDENILFSDNEFKEFIDNLKEKNKLDNTVVILSADHGETFENNRLGHGGTLYEPVMSVPLIIKMPNQSNGHIFNDIIEQIDIPTTILDLADITFPSWIEGRSLIPLMQNKEFEPRPAFAMHLVANRRSGRKIEKGTISVWEGDYKMIHNLEKRESMLFNLKKDPKEQDNLIDRESEVARHLLGLIQDNLKRANEKIMSGL